MNNFFYFILIVCINIPIYAQRGKHGNQSISGNNIILNSYSGLNQNAQIGDLSINTTVSNLTNGFFSSTIEQGDLILIIQMQGALIDVNTYPTVGWNGNYTVPNVFFSASWGTNPWEWGQVLNYYNAGKFEQAEVQSVSANTINLQCPLINDYDISGNVQVIRVPRFNDLTLPSNTSISCPDWNGSTGGVICLEINGTLDINSNSSIDCSEKGFRGGIADNTGLPGNLSICNTGAGNGCTALGSNSNAEGGRKGEGIAGYTTQYNLLYSIYGTGAPANGGGGGGWQNAGGGGGSNIGNGNYNGRGVPNNSYNTAWDLEYSGFANSVSSGGGRGGYSFSESDQNANSVGPNNISWGGDARKPDGGLGGHPLIYDSTRIFMGGAGGAGDQDSDQGGSGGKGGGIVILNTYGSIIGSGTIESNGQDGENSNPNNEQVFFGKKGNDGAGGGGAGGSILINNTNPIPSNILLSTKGGVGGNHNLTYLFGQTAEGSGPGGSGGGGSISYSSGTPQTDVFAGTSGISNSVDLTEFPPNGATAGDVGLINNNSSFDIQINDTVICLSSSVTLIANIIGSSNGTIAWYDQAFGGNVIHTGNTFVTPIINSNTTYYVGVCPGSFRDSVTITIGSSPTIIGIANILNSSCGNPGSITGLSASGGVSPYIFSWNGQNSTTINLNNANPGSYTLTITDSAGCTSNSGPYVIQGFGSPTIDTTGVLITHELCNGTGGNINGIIANGSGLSYLWSNAGGTLLNAQNLSAGSYTLTISDINGCTISTGPYLINYIAGPLVDTSLLSISNSNCNQSNGSISGITANGGGISYLWNPGAYTTANINALSPGFYDLTITDSNGCTLNIGPYNIADHQGPQIDTSLIDITPISCFNSTGSINGISVIGNYNLLTWSDPTLSTLNPTGLSAGNMTLTVTDSVGCLDSISLVINSYSTPIIDTSNISIIQPNCNQSGSINGIIVNGGTSPINIIWTGTIQNSLNIQNLLPGSYNLFITDSIGCQDSSLNMIINTPPTLQADFTYSPQNPQLNETIFFNNFSTGNFTNSSWEIDNLNFFVFEPTYSFSSSGSYPITLIITDANLCSDSITYIIEIIDEIKIPNVFSPNSDNLNDVFFITGLFPSSSLSIFNRWGEMVYFNDSYNNEWDGKDNSGKNLLEGVYSYIFIDHNNHKHHGFIHLYR